VTSLASTAYTRLASDSAGASVRAALGSATSILPADGLKRFATAVDLPSRLLIAFRGLERTGNARDGIREAFAWYLYDDDYYGYRRINDLIPLILAAYPDEDGLSDWYLTANGASPERPDAAVFSLPCRSLTFTAFTRRN
jgi:hypothetical protein